MSKRLRGKDKARRGWWLAGGGIATIAVIVLAVVAAARSGSATMDTSSSAAVCGANPLDFSVSLYQGSDVLGVNSLRFSSLLGDKPIILNYWASNCPPCSAEMPGFEEVWQQYQDRVLFFGLDVGGFAGFGGPEESRRELRRLGVTYPAAPIPDISVIRSLQVKGLPSTDFISPDGTVQKNWTGSLNGPKLTQLVEELLRVS